MKKLIQKDIKHTAELAKLKLSESELEKFEKELNSILEYMEILNEVDTKGVEETSQVTGLTNNLRKDKAGKSLKIDEVLRNVKKSKDGYIITQR